MTAEPEIAAALVAARVRKFWQRVDQRGGPNACWPWRGALGTNGYGKARDPVTHRDTGAYRVAYELAVGPIPRGLHLDHLCRVRPCCNPAHLEPVTHAENLRRSPLFRLLAIAQHKRRRAAWAAAGCP
jgi:hypothetical protein